MSPAVLLFLASLGCTPPLHVTFVETAAQARQEGAQAWVTTEGGVQVHELWHVCQCARLGPTKDQDDYDRREREAHIVETMFRAQ